MLTLEVTLFSVVDPGFPWGVWTPDAGAFQQNVCENERIGFHGGEVCAQHDPP